MATTKFTRVAQDEIMFDIKKLRFILAEKDQGVYGMGRAILLYQLDGVKKECIKTVGWIKSDNHDTHLKGNSILKGIVTLEDCKTASVKYLQTILK